GRLAVDLLAVLNVQDELVGITQVGGALRHVHLAAAEVGEASSAEVEPVAPTCGAIGVLLEWPQGRGTDPEVPVEAGRDRVFALGNAFVGGDADAPVVNLADTAEDSGLDQLDAAAGRGAGAALIAHL